MFLRSWLSGIQHRSVRVLGLITPANATLKRAAVTSRSGPEALEQRCLLTDFNLSSLGTGGITIFGVDGGDYSGASVSNAGDMNGDGFDDLLIGAKLARGANNALQEVGESYVVFGSGTPPSTINLANLGSAGVTIFGVDALDDSGDSVSGAGDVNGDGFDDLIIGARNADGMGNLTSGSGECYVIFGKASLPTSINLVSLGSAGVTIFGAEQFSHAGRSVSGAGDVNGDGFDDVIIGALDGNGSSNTGESYVVFGAASLPATIELANLGTAGITVVGIDEDDRSGVSVSTAGDVNGDGFDDIVIGALYADGVDNSKPDSGESYLIFGGDSLPATIGLANLGSAGVTLYGADPYDQSCLVSNAGDINGDGFDDLIIGATGGDGAVDNNSNSGEIYLVFGSATWPAEIDLGDLGADGVTIFGVDINDFTGVVSVAGDVNRDGFDDLLIGAPLANGPSNAKPLAGESYLVFGAATLPATISLASLGTAGITYLAIDSGDNLGRSVSNAGDVNGDGFDDIIIGASAADGANNKKANSGESYVIFGAEIPRIGGINAVTFVGKQPPVVILPQVVLAEDVHSGGGTLTVAISGTPGVRAKKALDHIAFPSTNGLGLSSPPQLINGKLTLDVQLNQNVTNSSVQAFLRGITFSTKGKGLKTLNRTVDITLAEAAGGPVHIAHQTINVRKKA